VTEPGSVLLDRAQLERAFTTWNGSQPRRRYAQLRTEQARTSAPPAELIKACGITVNENRAC
jgi:hypothetical protein